MSRNPVTLCFKMFLPDFVAIRALIELVAELNNN